LIFHIHVNWKNMGTNLKVNKGLNRLTLLLFTIYLIVLYWILLFKLGVRFSYIDKRSVNFIPFNDPTILNAENILNVLIFIPLGIYTGVLFKRWSFGKKLFFFFFLSFIVESLQYILRLGALDVTDLITNTLGGVIGLMIFKVIEKLFNNNARTEKFINVFAATGTVIMILLLALLKLNMLPVKFQ